MRPDTMFDDGRGPGSDAIPDTVLWRRIDAEGHDACRLDRIEDGYRLTGMAVWTEPSGGAALRYRVECGPDWRTRSADVDGFHAGSPLELKIRADGQGRWRKNDILQKAVEGMVDLDLGFTPATNIFPIRRLAVRPGRLVPAPAAWLDITDLSLKILEQTYRRIDAENLSYTAPLFDYEADLTTRPSGLIRSYPGLWQEVDGVRP
ncbi:MAG: putative glycolipid-binding domain-containing protein [Alphaproteobacteria bacterium]|nr:putative glycolipid-binding domain-containing protein [Alphaproteobacteria bacterium]MBO6861912.1 putative glycolipid-binding domain-containing protein [Alphaproteobacteria bacterium]